MEHDPSEPRMPSLRGLDPARLIEVLDDGADTPVPEIPGWHITGVAGEGGSGKVWQATRIRDGVPAAIKIASPDDPETLDRIEQEAAVLRALRHPHIVELLETGPVETGPCAGGLYLAMEFVDGPAMAHEIPEHGLPPAKACEWFRQIAAAVAHAHDAGILHRDLKPANVLVTAAGHVKVADFGLARPVHRRVHMLSLTRAGLVAGTAEYLPPEAYHRNYRPAPAADIFALGVMLHEMLTGTPPRGAWLPASSHPGVDVRIDGIIARAMDPDPAARWPDPRSMVTALDAVLASPPRFSGVPLVTLPVRVADSLWTLLGMAILLAGTSSLLRLEKSRILLPLDLVGDQGRLTGGFQALLLLLLASIPLCLWQLVRLRRFRHVPLREALPSPFGLKLGHNRLAAALVAACQIFLVALPALEMLNLYLSSCLTWLQPTDPPWAHGLAVTSMDDHEFVSPWAIGKNGVGYWLWESFGPPRHGLTKPVDRIGFAPFLHPLLMVLAATLLATTWLATAWTACRQWWLRARHPRSITLACATAALSLLLLSVTTRETRAAQSSRHSDTDPWVVNTHMTAHVRDLADFLLGKQTTFSHPVTGSDWLSLYQESVDYRDLGLVDRREIPRLLEQSRPHANSLHLEVTHYNQSWNPADGKFWVRAHAVQAFDGLQPGNLCGADDILLELHGRISIDGATVIRHEVFVRTPMYRADRRTATHNVASAWADSFLHASSLAQSHPDTCDNNLAQLFLAVPGGFPDEADSGWIRHIPNSKHGLPAVLAAEAPRVSKQPPAIQESLPGGRTRISLPFQSADGRPPRMLVVDLISYNKSWRCVKLAF